MTFTSEAIDQIAENCLKLKTGARGLHNEIERVLLPIMYDSKIFVGQKVVITKQQVDDPESIIL